MQATCEWLKGLLSGSQKEMLATFYMRWLLRFVSSSMVLLCILSFIMQILSYIMSQADSRTDRKGLNQLSLLFGN